MVFVPRRLKEWKPERAYGPIRRRCHWCAGERMRLREMLQVLEGPMRYHFCKDACYDAWQQHRHEPQVVAWLRVCTGERHKILHGGDDARTASAADCSGSPGVRSVPDVEVPVPQDH